MRFLARLVLLIAAFAYGGMPMTGMAAMAMPVAHAVTMAGDPHQPEEAAMADIDCPHSGRAVTIADGENGADHSSKPMQTSTHCAACLTLPVHVSLRDSGKPARAAEVSTLSPILISLTAAPQTPPPRA
ncbi:hypothetical protein FVA81_19970 [Rhizobium sp. WL3]|uniref:hypothetical protein n=1 Tax=Rhizobium sp. WL3 TaxID=2603277 RepID=UPI0011C20706|nr:hypothetical protein [Rhizobium sp. WL3]QEE46739.1 hypothetical protein FVA81_19970 [Rhizobium sp. WL3]